MSAPLLSWELYIIDKFYAEPLVGAVALVSLTSTNFQGIIDPENNAQIIYKIIVSIWNISMAMIALSIGTLYLMLR